MINLNSFPQKEFKEMELIAVTLDRIRKKEKRIYGAPRNQKFGYYLAHHVASSQGVVSGFSCIHIHIKYIRPNDQFSNVL